MAYDFSSSVDKVWSIWDSLSWFFQWVVAFFKFLWNSVITILNSIWNLFLNIFDRDLFDILNDVLVFLSSYLWSVWAFLFISLFVLVFSILILSFLFRLLRGRVNYDATIKRYNKNHPKT